MIFTYFKLSSVCVYINIYNLLEKKLIVVISCDVVLRFHQFILHSKRRECMFSRNVFLRMRVFKKLISGWLQIIILVS